MTPAELALDIVLNVQLTDNTPEEAMQVKGELVSLIATALTLERSIAFRAGAEAARDKLLAETMRLNQGVAERLIRDTPLPEMPE